jgi:excinuclease ABC subunit C
LASRLDSIPGIGPNRRKALLRHFGSIEAIQEASLDQLTAVKGITLPVAKALKSGLE